MLYVLDRYPEPSIFWDWSVLEVAGHVSSPLGEDLVRMLRCGADYGKDLVEETEGDVLVKEIAH